MKTKQIVKTAGLLAAFSFSSLSLVSCDDDDQPSSNISDNNGNSNAVSISNTKSTDLVIGGIFLADVGDGTYKYTISEVNTDEQNVNGSGTIEVTFDGTTTTATNLPFTFNNNELIINDNRLSDSAVTTALRQLTGSGGAAESQFNAVINSSDESEEENLINDLLSAIQATSPSFGLDYLDADDLFVVRDITMNSQFLQVGGSAIDGETAATLTVISRESQYNDSANITYTTP